MDKHQITEKPASPLQSAGSEASANLARQVWEKPGSGAAGPKDNFDPTAEHLTPKSGPVENTNTKSDKPNGGGGHSADHDGNSPADGSTAGERGSKNEKSDKALPTENKSKPNGNGMHSIPKEHVDKQDAALKFLPAVSIG